MKSNIEILLDNPAYYSKLKQRQLESYEKSRKFSMILKNKLYKSYFRENNSKGVEYQPLSRLKKQQEERDSSEERQVQNLKDIDNTIQVTKYDTYENNEDRDNDNLNKTHNFFLTDYNNNNDDRREFLKKKFEMDQRILTFYKIYEDDHYSDFYNTVNFISFNRVKKKPPLKKNNNLTKIQVKYSSSLHKKCINDEFQRNKDFFKNVKSIKTPQQIEDDEDFLGKVIREREECGFDKSKEKKSLYTYNQLKNMIHNKTNVHLDNYLIQHANINSGNNSKINIVEDLNKDLQVENLSNNNRKEFNKYHSTNPSFTSYTNNKFLSKNNLHQDASKTLRENKSKSEFNSNFNQSNMKSDLSINKSKSLLENKNITSIRNKNKAFNSTLSTLNSLIPKNNSKPNLKPNYSENNTINNNINDKIFSYKGKNKTIVNAYNKKKIIKSLIDDDIPSSVIVKQNNIGMNTSQRSFYNNTMNNFPSRPKPKFTKGQVFYPLQTFYKECEKIIPYIYDLDNNTKTDKQVDNKIKYSNKSSKVVLKNKLKFTNTNNDKTDFFNDLLIKPGDKIMSISESNKDILKNKINRRDIIVEENLKRKRDKLFEKIEREKDKKIDKIYKSFYQ